ncbi:cyclic lactone autoinducer peptide [Orenia marismortui]|uniref:Cyclic lactone autoinducer peptide n=1 Tax=Orenia marismortui TaxID=46469 RepID=A0A4R8H835_9FIRM|nr:cyclic lactone autoinducer peptide [Orenia marismortui]TDX51805.1 cyclic lactone autoinducer peptide [Orenia marismortui]
MKSKKLISKVLKGVAKRSSKSASFYFVYQPEVPKALKEDK